VIETRKRKKLGKENREKEEEEEGKIFSGYESKVSRVMRK
jgi:hypothetical protein